MSEEPTMSDDVTAIAQLRAAAQSAATLLLTLNRRGGLGLDVHAAIEQTLTPLTTALASISPADEHAVHEIGELRRQLAASQGLEAYWHQQYTEPWRMIGRLDYALEQIGAATTLATARQWATKMRGEILTFRQALKASKES